MDTINKRLRNSFENNKLRFEIIVQTSNYEKVFLFELNRLKMPPKEKEVSKICSSTRMFHCQLIFCDFVCNKVVQSYQVFFMIFFDQDHNFHDFKNTINLSKVSSINDVTVFS